MIVALGRAPCGRPGADRPARTMGPPLTPSLRRRSISSASLSLRICTVKKKRTEPITRAGHPARAPPPASGALDQLDIGWLNFATAAAKNAASFEARINPTEIARPAPRNEALVCTVSP